jgi:hypothetical protein
MLAASLAAGACGLARLASPSPPVGQASPVPSAPASEVSIPPSTTPSVIPATVDPALLEVLPASVDGLERQTDSALDAELATDPQLASAADGFATAVYVDPASGLFAYASVVELRDGVFGEAFYRDWRTTFDEGACSQAGGVGGNAEAAIGGHRTFIGTCAGGLRTYHTYLEEKGLLVSISAPDQRRLGERVIEGLLP